MLRLFDTNIILLYLREVSLVKLIESKFRPFDLPNEAVISIVTIAELKSIALQNSWGKLKLAKMRSLLAKFIIIDISGEDILNRYAEIDAFSQGGLIGRVSNFTSRNMGKNDLWIAATASVLDATLLTTDKDFEHLDGEFLQIGKIDIKK